MFDSNIKAFKTAIKKACSVALPRKQLKVFGVVCLKKDKKNEQTLQIEMNINNEEVGAGQSQQSVDENHRVSADTTELSNEICKFAQRLISYEDQLEVVGIINISHITTDYCITLKCSVDHTPVPTGNVKRNVYQSIEDDKNKTVTKVVIPPKDKKQTKKEIKGMQDKPLFTGSVKRNVGQKSEEGKTQPVTKDVNPTHCKKQTKKEDEGTQDKPFPTDSEQTVNKQEKICHMGTKTFISPNLKAPKIQLQTEHGLIQGLEDTMQFVHVHEESKTAETGRYEYGDYSTTITTPSRPVAATNVNMKRKNTSQVEQVGANASTIGKKAKQEMSEDMTTIKDKLTCRNCKKKILYRKKCMIKHIKICANVSDQDALGYIKIG
ncbi:uncharacterized protein LOC128244711 [Mya arenaria]|nr:uncharacterized protein LOC128244711 [Mya arenaria]